MKWQFQWHMAYIFHNRPQSCWPKYDGIQCILSPGVGTFCLEEDTSVRGSGYLKLRDSSFTKAAISVAGEVTSYLVLSQHRKEFITLGRAPSADNTGSKENRDAIFSKLNYISMRTAGLWNPLSSITPSSGSPCNATRTNILSRACLNCLLYQTINEILDFKE